MPIRRPSLRSLFGKLITVAQVSIDFLTVCFAFLGSFWFYEKILDRWSPITFRDYLLLALVAAGVYCIILDRVGMYKREVSLLNIKELRGIFYVGVYGAAVLLGLSFYLRAFELSRITVTLSLILVPLLLYVQRQAFYKIHLIFHQRGWSQKRVFIFGAGKVGQQLAKRMFQSPSLGLLPVGFLDDGTEKQGQRVFLSDFGPKKGVPILGGDECLSKAVEMGIEEVYIATPFATFERNQILVNRCMQMGLAYSIVPNSYTDMVYDLETIEIGGIPILRRRSERKGLSYRASKRFLDVVLSVALILVLLPFVFLIGMAIRLDSKGSVIFKQKRIGFRGKSFTLYKFRSMFVDVPQYAPTPGTSEDSRITRVGKWLRRTSLDELPQLFNVFRGEMSLVGPRPEMPFIVEQYDSVQRMRLYMKPGITGVWQISAVRGEPIHENIEYDLFYLQNQSLLLDVAILVKTFFSVIRGVGAF